MFNTGIGKVVVKTSKISSSLETVTFNSIRKVLPDRAIIEACRQADYDYRKRLITPIVTVLHMIIAAIWPEDSFVASWQLTWSSFAANCPSFVGRSPHGGTVAKARKRLPLKVWKNIVQWLCQQARENSEAVSYWRSHRIVSVDGTCLTVPDEPQLCKEFGISKGNYGDKKYPLTRLVCLCLSEAMTVIDYRLGGYRDDENHER